MRYNRNIPCHAVEGFHDLRRRRDVCDEHDRVSAVFLQAGELRHHVEIIVVELFDSGQADAAADNACFNPLSFDSPQELLISMSPGFFAPYFAIARPTIA